MEGLSKDILHMVIKRLCPWNECDNWLDTRKMLHSVLPMRLVNQHWCVAVDTCFYYWRFVYNTTPVLNQFNLKPSKETIIQYLRQQKMLKQIKK